MRQPVTKRIRSSLALSERWQSGERPELEASLARARAAKAKRDRARKAAKTRLENRLRAVAGRHGEEL